MEEKPAEYFVQSRASVHQDDEVRAEGGAGTIEALNWRGQSSRVLRCAWWGS